MGRTRKQQVGAAVAAIRAFHAIGRRLPQKQSFKDGYGRGVVRAEADRLGVNEDTARKARTFADPKKGYTAADLERLVRLVERVQAGQPAGTPVFGRTHVIRMLSVPKADRADFQREAVEGGWSVGELEAAIAARYGARRGGGRRPRVAADAAGLLVQAEGMCEAWRRWLVVVDPRKNKTGRKDEAEAEPAHATLADLPANIRTLAREAGEALAALQKEVAAALKKRNAGRHARQPSRGDDE